MKYNNHESPKKITEEEITGWLNEVLKEKRNKKFSNDTNGIINSIKSNINFTINNEKNNIIN